LDEPREVFDLILLGDDGATVEGDAARWLARMEGMKTMKKIAGQHEKDRFWSEYQEYQTV
jgi:hypothetical protein